MKSTSRGAELSIPPSPSAQPFRLTVRRPSIRFGLAIVCAAACGLSWSGCRVAEETVQAPVRAVGAIVPGKKSAQPEPGALQVELQRFADEYGSMTAAALDEYAKRANTQEARRQALQWKVSVGFAAMSIASGPNPQANLLDFLTLATITRTLLQEVLTKSTDGPAFQPWLATSLVLETNAWKLAGEVFSPEQQQELRDSIRQWWEANPETRAGFFVRPQDFATLIRRTGQKPDRPQSIFSLVGLDPTAGLDPAVREVERTRLFAERAMFIVQRVPFLVRWQVELLADELLREDQVAAALTSADRLSRAAESASQTAAALPDRITAERKAVLEALEVQEGKLRALSADIARTLAAGERMSTSLDTTITDFDALMKRFGVGEPDTSPSPVTNSHPFNILDYAQTAERISTMAQQLGILVKDTGSALDSPALDKRIAELGVLADRGRADAKSVLNHAFLLAAGLIVLTFACALVYRRLAPRGRPESAPQPVPKPNP